MALVFVVWIFCGLAAALVAQSRGASGFLWFVLGFLFGPIGLAFAFASKKPEIEESKPDDPRTLALLEALRRRAETR